jgi:FixJ family two-component response regulator
LTFHRIAIANIRTSTQSSSTLVAVVDEAESVGEGDGGLMLSIGYRAESYASTEKFLFPRRLREPDDLILDLKTPGMGRMALRGLLAGVNLRAEEIESKSDCHSSCIAGCRILEANLPNSQCCTQT